MEPNGSASSGNPPKWRLHRAQIWNNGSWETAHFYFGAALSAPASATAKRLLDVTYEFSVTTSDVPGNGHDGSVCVTLEGEQVGGADV